jgi:hypothetical protein
MDDLICDALGRVLQQDEALDVYVYPPESVIDYPAAVILETDGAGSREAYRGSWGVMVSVRVVILVQPRVELAEAVEAARPWARRVLALLAAHDELKAMPDDIPLADLDTIEWTSGRLDYAGTAWAAVDFELAYRTDLQIAVACSGIGEHVDTHTD